MDSSGNVKKFIEESIDSEPDTQTLFIGLEVDVACTIPDRLSHDEVKHSRRGDVPPGGCLYLFGIKMIRLSIVPGFGRGLLGASVDQLLESAFKQVPCQPIILVDRL